jgi:hypothetical protein
LKGRHLAAPRGNAGTVPIAGVTQDAARGAAALVVSGIGVYFLPCVASSQGAEP